MRRGRFKDPKDDESEPIGMRLLAAVVSVPVFELSLYLGFYAATGSRRSAYHYFALPLWLHAAYIAAAVTVGLLFGFPGITWLLGHLFLTHFPKDRNEMVTVSLWAAISALALVGYLCTRAQ